MERAPRPREVKYSNQQKANACKLTRQYGIKGELSDYDVSTRHQSKRVRFNPFGSNAPQGLERPGADYDNDSQQNEPDIVCTKVLADPHHRNRLMKEKR